MFELDFDRQVFSAVHILDGWKSYRFQDVSAAAYQAFRKEHSSQEERWRKFVSRLEGKELTDRDLGAPLKALRDLQPGDLLFTEPANRMGRLLDFQVDCSSDTVQMEVFGPEENAPRPAAGSTSTSATTWPGRRCGITWISRCTEKTAHGRSRSPMSWPRRNRNFFGQSWRTHCQNRYGQTLNGLYAERYRLEGCEPLVLDGGTRRLDMSAVSFEEEPMECCGKLNFYIPVTFDPDAVFGTHVASESNDDWLNVYANYDLEAGEPEKALTVVLVCSDGHEFEFSYPLTAPEREQLREKMEDYCQAQTGMSLEKYRQELCSEESSMEQGHQL